MAGDEGDALPIFSATERACLGSQASSSTSSASFLPSTPPEALRSATAISAPFFIWRPKAELSPVMGPATAMVMSSAKAAVESASEAPIARPMSFSDFMRSSPSRVGFWIPAPGRVQTIARHCRPILQRSHRQIPSSS